jgi:hypothetical protein
MDLIAILEKIIKAADEADASGQPKKADVADRLVQRAAQTLPQQTPADLHTLAQTMNALNQQYKSEFARIWQALKNMHSPNVESGFGETETANQYQDPNTITMPAGSNINMSVPDPSNLNMDVSL